MARKSKPVKILTLDTETYNGLLGKIKRIAVFDGEEVTYGYRFSDIEHILVGYSKNFNVHVYIHNLEFDLRKMPEVLQDDNVIWEKSFVINGKVATIVCQDYTIHDSFKLLPKSLSSLSKDFEVEHGKLDLWDEVEKRYKGQYSDLVDFLDRCDTENELFLEYLGYDVMSLYEVIEKLISLTGIEVNDFVKRVSTASLSRYIFKNGYKGKQFKEELSSMSDYEQLCKFNFRNSREIEDFIRCSYCGGRCEVFKPQLQTNGYHYDVNSLYPSQFGKDYPVGKPEFYSDAGMAEEYFNKWIETHDGLGFLSCTVYVPNQHIPPLPVKMGKLTFPCGTVYGTWTYEELEYAIKNCGVKILEFHEVCHFYQTFPVFKRFCDTFYQMKEQATIDKNESLRQFAKLLLNVAYGYTGMTRDDKTQLKPFKDIEKYDNIVYADEEIGFIEIPADVTSEYIQVQVASYVTSRARLVLLEALRKMDDIGDVYYCDTDSIVSSHEMPSEMVHDSKLGYWGLESEPLEGVFLRPKVYAERYEKYTNVKFKGVTKDTQKTLCYDDYINLKQEMGRQTKEYIIVEKNRLTMRSIMYMEKNKIDIDDNRIHDKENNIITGYEIRDKKVNLRTIEKRQINYSENFTKPYYFETIEEFESFSFKPPKKDVQFNMRGEN